jgi:hypothetical protein
MRMGVIVVMAIMRVVVAMMIVRVVVVIMAAIRAMHVNLLGARSTPRFAPSDGFGHQPVFLGHGGVLMLMAMTVVIVAMLVAMRVIVLLVMVMIVVVMVVAAHRAEAIGPTFRLECGRDEAHFGTEFLDEFDQNVVVADAQGPLKQLRRRMPVAEMPGDPGDDVRIVGAEFNEPFRLAFDQHDPAGLKQEAVAFNQRRRVRKVNVEFAALGADHRAAPTAAILEVKLDGIDCGCRIKRAGIQGLGRSDHG